MASKRITCPELCGILPGSNPVIEYGLVEYLQDVVLKSANAIGSALGSCEMTLRVFEQTLGLRGPAQVGLSIYLKKDEWEDLCRRIAQVAQLPGQKPEDLYAFALCNRAILLAADVADEDVPQLRLKAPRREQPTEATAPGGQA